MKSKKVTLIDEDGNKKEVSLDDAVFEWVEHYDWEECEDLMFEHFSLTDIQKMIISNMTDAQKLDFLDKESEKI